VEGGIARADALALLAWAERYSRALVLMGLDETALLGGPVHSSVLIP